MLGLFRVFVILHIATGSVGLLSFWVPVVGKKGDRAHRRFGRIFLYSMLATGTAAIGISTCTILAPMECHPRLHAPFTPAIVRGIFGWMMQYLAILTISLAWYGWCCIRNPRRHAENRRWPNVALQIAVLVTALNCALQGWIIHQPLMMGISVVGLAAGLTNLRFIYNRVPGPTAWLNEHIKALVGAGISVYTAFFAFGAVRLVPSIALNPVLWAVPLVTGLSIILYQWRNVARRFAIRPGTEIFR